MIGKPIHNTAISKIVSDGTLAHQTKKTAPRPEPINHNRWSHFHRKNQLDEKFTAPKAQELPSLEISNMRTVEDVYGALRRDGEVQEWIERIRGHEWVKVVEGKENV